MWVEAEQPGAPSGEPLGELLVSRGLLTHEQLEQALAEQSSCKRPLGEVIVRLGFTTGPTIAQALATQHGRIFKSEYGFATGFDATLDVPEIDAPPVTTRQDGKLTLAPPPAGTDDQADTPGDRSQEPPPPAATPQPAPEPAVELAAAEAQLDQLAEQLTNAAGRIVNAEMARDTALRTTDETKAAYAALAQEKEQLAARVETLESELAEAQSAVAESQRTTETEAAEIRQRAARLEAELDQARRERDETKTQLQTAEDTNHTLRHQHEAGRQEGARLDQTLASVAELEERLADAEAESHFLELQLAATLAQRDSALTQVAALEHALTDANAEVDEPTAEAHHLIFFPAAGRGYQLLEREGPTPPVGDLVDLSTHGGPHAARVAKIAAPPLADTPLRCAYLL